MLNQDYLETIQGEFELKHITNLIKIKKSLVKDENNVFIFSNPDFQSTIFEKWDIKNNKFLYSFNFTAYYIKYFFLQDMLILYTKKNDEISFCIFDINSNEIGFETRDLLKKINWSKEKKKKLNLLTSQIIPFPQSNSIALIIYQKKILNFKYSCFTFSVYSTGISLQNTLKNIFSVGIDYEKYKACRLDNEKRLALLHSPNKEIIKVKK